jgi:hypothetical protein
LRKNPKDQNSFPLTLDTNYRRIVAKPATTDFGQILLTMHHIPAINLPQSRKSRFQMRRNLVILGPPLPDNALLTLTNPESLWIVNHGAKGVGRSAIRRDSWLIRIERPREDCAGRIG